MKKQINEVQGKVKQVLTTNLEARDNDSILILEVWYLQNPVLNKPTVLFKGFAMQFRIGHFASTESIRRARQRLQQFHPELRGKLYKQRHEEAKVISDSIHKGII